MEFVISQICGMLVSVFAILSMQLKNVKHILVCQLICNVAGAFSYILLGGFSGCGIYIVAVVQTIVYYFYSKTNKKAPNFMVFVFLVLFLLCSITTYKGKTDIIPAIASFTCAMALAQSKASGYRICMLLNGLLWMIYDVSVSAYSMMLSHIITFASAGIGIIRLDIKKSK